MGGTIDFIGCHMRVMVDLQCDAMGSIVQIDLSMIRSIGRQGMMVECARSGAAGCGELCFGTGDLGGRLLAVMALSLYKIKIYTKQWRG
jgi:hypothetical protein